MRARRYNPAQIAGETPSELRRQLAEELSRISDAMLRDIDEVGDSRHPTTLETGLMIWVNRAGTLSLNRVSVGAADSGGVGYRLLRVVN